MSAYLIIEARITDRERLLRATPEVIKQYGAVPGDGWHAGDAGGGAR